MRQSILEALQRGYQEGETLCGIIANRAKGGIMIYVADIIGFLPNEQLPSSYSHRAYKGHEIYVKITGLEREGRGRVYLSLESLPEPDRRVRCKSCPEVLPRVGSIGGECFSCYLQNHKPPSARMVPGGSPGLKKKLTIRVGKRRTRRA